jgi:hypothetical protein
VDLRKLLQKVETAPVGSPELDSEFVSTFRSEDGEMCYRSYAQMRMMGY